MSLTRPAVLPTQGNGLQVMAGDGRSGDWRDVPYAPGSFVVNLGDLMSRWTNSKWVSTLHRVVMPSAERPGSLKRRQSMAFFHNINPQQVRISDCAHSNLHTNLKRGPGGRVHPELRQR